MTDTVDKIIIESQIQGADQTAAGLKKVESGLTGVTVASDKTEKSTASVENRFKSLERSLGTTSGQQQKFEKVQKDINLAVAQNPALQDRANEALKAAEARYVGTAAATTRLAAGTGLASHELTNLSRQAQDVAVSLGSGQSFGTVLLQQGTQIADVFASSKGTVAGFFGQVVSGAGAAVKAVSAFITPARLAAGAATAIGVEAIYAAHSWAESQIQIERALAGIGKASGATAEDVTRAAATSASATNTSFSAAQAGATELLKTGTVYKDTFSELTLVTSKFALATGTDTVEAAQKLSAAFEGDEKAIMALNKQYGFLNATTLNQIRTYNQLGDAQNAQLTFLKAFEPVLDKLEDKGGAWSRTFSRIVNTASNINSALGATLSGGSSDQERVANLTSQRDQITSQNATVGPSGSLNLPDPELIAGINKQIAELEAKIKAADDAARAAQIDKLGLQVDAITRSAIPAIGQLEQLSQAYFKLQQAKDAGITSPENDAASAAIQVQRALLIESADQAERYNQRVTEISLSYKDMSTSAALAHQATVNELPVIEAIGGAAKMAAQYAADYANAMDKGKPAADALVLASDNLAKSQAAANTAAKESIQSMKDQNELAKARTVEEEKAIAAQQKYNEVLKATGEPLLAEEAKLQVIESYNIKINNAARQRVASYRAAADAAEREAIALVQAAQASANAYEASYTLASGKGTSASQSGAGGSGDAAAFGSQTVGGSYTSTTGATATYRMGANGTTLGAQLYDYFPNPNGATQTKVADLTNSINSLIGSTDSLNVSTDSLNATMGDVLSPYYTQDPRTSHLGFRAPGMATGGEFTVPGGYSANDNMMASIPVASGEIVSVRRPSESGGRAGQTVNINQSFHFNGNVNRDEVGRTAYQAGQNTARQLQAAGR